MSRDLNRKGLSDSQGELEGLGVEESLDRELGTAWRPLCSMQTKKGKEREFREGSYFRVSYQL